MILSKDGDIFWQFFCLVEYKFGTIILRADKKFKIHAKGLLVDDRLKEG